MSLSVLTSCALQKSSNKLPIADFFRNPDQIGLRISPNGLYIAYLQSSMGQMNLAVKELATGTVKLVTHETENDISRYKWVNNHQLLYLRDKDKNEQYHLYLTDKDNAIEQDLTPFKGVRVNWIDEERTYQNKVYFGMNKASAQLEDLYELDLRQATLRILMANPGNEQFLSIKKDNEGLLRIIIVTNGVNEAFFYRPSQNEPFTKRFTTEFKDQVIPLAFSGTNQTVYVSSNIGRDKSAIVAMDPGTGKELKLIYENPGVDVTEIFYSKVKKSIIYAAYTDWRRQVQVLDDSAHKPMRLIEKAFPNLEVRLMDYDSSETNIILRVYNDRNWGYYYQFNRFTNKLTKLSELSPWIDEQAMAPMRPIVFKSRDGKIIHGYLTLPHSSSGTLLPLIVRAHPGPFTRDTWLFDRETQFFASRGYAVLQVNFRGSTGYGKQFYEDSFKQWGRKIQDDLTDATRWAIREQVADPGRICLYGIGFGGYCALMGAIREPTLYRCVASLSGISNLFDYVKDVPPEYQVLAQRLMKTIGDPIRDMQYFREVSPVFHAGSFKVPVFIAQGGKDKRVRSSETDYFVKELFRNGVPVTYFFKPEEGTYFTKVNDKLEYYDHLEQFLAQNLKPRS